MGAAVGAAMFPTSPCAQALCTIGAAFPDMPIVAQVLVDKYKDRPLFSCEQEGTIWFLTKEISHSPLCWGLGLMFAPFLGSFWGIQFAAFFIGILSHCFTDIFSHSGSEFRATDQSLAWPFYQVGLVPKLGGFFGLWKWDYRHNPPTLKPKWPESIVIIICFVLWIFLTIRNYHLWM